MKKILFTLLALAFIISAKAQTPDTVKKLASDTTIFENPDVKPEFPGGKSKLYKYLAKTTRYPASGVEKHIQGKVILRLLIEKDGMISDIKVVQSVSDDIDKEAVRVLRAAPQFTPGLVNGKPVRCYYVFPFSFALAN